MQSVLLCSGYDPASRRRPTPVAVGRTGRSLRSLTRPPLNGRIVRQATGGSAKVNRHEPILRSRDLLGYLKENARRFWPQVKYLEIVMSGNAAYSKHTGVYSLEAITPLGYPHDRWRQ